MPGVGSKKVGQVSSRWSNRSRIDSRYEYKVVCLCITCRYRPRHPVVLLHPSHKFQHLPQIVSDNPSRPSHSLYSKQTLPGKSSPIRRLLLDLLQIDKWFRSIFLHRRTTLYLCPKQQLRLSLSNRVALPYQSYSKENIECPTDLCIVHRGNKLPSDTLFCAKDMQQILRILKRANSLDAFHDEHKRFRRVERPRRGVHVVQQSIDLYLFLVLHDQHTHRISQS